MTDTPAPNEMPDELAQSIFDGQPPEVVIACVDYDGLLKFGDNIDVRYTLASERWRGCNWISKIEGTSISL